MGPPFNHTSREHLGGIPWFSAQSRVYHESHVQDLSHFTLPTVNMQPWRARWCPAAVMSLGHPVQVAQLDSSQTPYHFCAYSGVPHWCLGLPTATNEPSKHHPKHHGPTLFLTCAAFGPATHNYKCAQQTLPQTQWSILYLVCTVFGMSLFYCPHVPDHRHTTLVRSGSARGSIVSIVVFVASHHTRYCHHIQR